MIEDDALKISSHIDRFYQLASKSIPTRNSRGTVNTTWILDDHVLTIFRDKNFEQCVCLADILVQDDTGYLPKPIKSSTGWVSIFQDKPAILYNKIAGEHFVGLDHSQKISLPAAAHASVAGSFWKVNRFLSRHTPLSIPLGKMDYLASMKIAQNSRKMKPLPECLNMDFVTEYLEADILPLSHRSLVHTDMERHNLLHAPDGTVTGVVDVDAIMQGDLLYEYAHLMMNFAFTDPDYKPAYADAYMHAIASSWVATKEVVATLPKLLRLFAAEDLFYYYGRSGQTPTNLEGLAAIYKQGVERANAFFKA